MQVPHETGLTRLRPPAPKPQTKEDIMKKTDRPSLGEKARWAMGAVGIVLAYFGVFALLMYPVVEASSRLG